MGIDCRVEFDWLPDRECVTELWVEVLRALECTGILPSIMYRTANSKKAALQKPVNLRDGEQVRGFVSKALNDRAWSEGIAVDDLWSDEPGRCLIRFSLFGFQRDNFFILECERSSQADLNAALGQIKVRFPISVSIVNLAET